KKNSGLHNTPDREYIPTANLFIPSASAFIGGIAWTVTGITPSTTTAWSILSILALIIVLTSPFPISRTTRFLLLPLFFLIGLVLTNPVQPPKNDPEHLYSQVPVRQEMTLFGTLTKCPTENNEESRLIMSVDGFLLPQADSPTPSQGLIRLTLRGKLPEDLLPGDRFAARAKISRTRSFSNPGGFNYTEFLGSKGIWLTGWIGAPSLIMEVHNLSPPSLAQRLRYMPERIRFTISRFLNTTLDSRMSGLYKSILIGDRSGADPALLENFKAAGCMHLLAISGIHMALLAFLSIMTLKWLLTRSTTIILHLSALKLASFATLIPLLGYALVAGFQPPVVRALIMTTVFVFALLSDRQWSVINNIFIAALIILASNPNTLFTASFQLSFSAVLAIALICPKIRPLLSTPVDNAVPTRHLTRLKNWAIASIAVSVVASLGTMPLLLYHFNRFSLFSPISTLIVEPFLCFWSLILGLTACLAIPFSPSAASFIFHLGTLGLKASDAITQFFASLPGSSLWLPTPFPVEIALFYLFLASCVFWRKSRFIRLAGILSLVFLVSIPTAVYIRGNFSKQTEVTFLDVGQGSSAFIKMPGGAAFLIDGGGPQSLRFNIGSKIIAPYLWRQRISRLDGVIISHPHADHYNGLEFIFRRFRPKALWTNGEQGDDPEYRKLLHLAEHLDIPIQIPKEDTVLFTKGETSLRSIAALHTTNLPPDRPDSDPNNRSLVIRLDSGPGSFLFAGDIYKKDEIRLIQEGKNLDADVLLAPHHGSRTSGSNDFLKAVSPDCMVISAGPYRTGVFPDEKLLERAKKAGIRVFNTAEVGAIRFMEEKSSLKVLKLLTTTTDQADSSIQ
ncbi:MAG: DNA internalization-related competence protein ComEC/Rec2, partial [Desulfobulbaceae bacterium]|nr:DNA internalization-related competence protein ComEC/Rec2 [Desulfobulbaceae bacterium]